MLWIQKAVIKKLEDAEIDRKVFAVSHCGVVCVQVVATCKPRWSNITKFTENQGF